MSEQTHTEQAHTETLTDDDLTVVVGGNTDPDDPEPTPRSGS
jgi:hypothetical protein